jgi:choline kinase
MRPILIGAGRGSRLAHETAELPKTLVPTMGRPMLEWILEALADAGFQKKDVVFVSGYREDVLKARYPEFTYVSNKNWKNNNILMSLFTAREHMRDGFLCSYTDILYRGDTVKQLVEAPHASVLGCDTDWRRRYRDRSQHPETDGEKMRVEDELVVEVSRHIAPKDADGEFIGVAKFSPDGARQLGDAFDRERARKNGALGDKAYLIELFQRMIESGAEFRRVDTHGGYMELDTLEDLACAEKWWKESR